MMQTPPISTRDVIPIEEKRVSKPLEAIVETATSIKDFFLEKILRGFFGSGRNLEADYEVLRLREEALVSDSDLIQARKFSWAVMAYQKIFERGKTISSPGPGNGYFDTVQILLEQIELLARRFLIAPKEDRVTYFKCIERIFPGAPSLTRCLYPAILYFVALRIRDECKIRDTEKLGSDFWHATVHPSKKLTMAANYLIAGTHNMFNSLRYGNEESFRTVYPEYEKHWLGFFEQLQIDSIEAASYICPDLEIEAILKILSDCPLYDTKKNIAREIASAFDTEHYKVVLSIVRYPNRLIETTENNRAYDLALLLIKQASKTINTYSDDSWHEVKILEFPREI